jgi:hypothetical protein
MWFILLRLESTFVALKDGIGGGRSLATCGARLTVLEDETPSKLLFWSCLVIATISCNFPIDGGKTGQFGAGDISVAIISKRLDLRFFLFGLVCLRKYF